MKIMKSLKMAAVWMACAGMASPVASFGSTPTIPQDGHRIEATDVALSAGNVLSGQLVDEQGQALARQSVMIQGNGQPATHVQTDQRGQFQVAALQGGVYQVMTPTTQGVYRVWTDQTAPPAATKGILLVDDSAVLRGQCTDGCATGAVPGQVLGQGGYYPAPAECGHGFLHFLANPWVIGAAVAAAIAIPIALSDDDAS